MDAQRKVMSLFSGGGGMDIGFDGGFECLKKSINTNIYPSWISAENGSTVCVKRTGFKTVFANDILQSAKSAWVSYFKNHIEDAEDIYRVESIVDIVKRVKDGKEYFPKNIDVVIGGFPCQDFSVSGKRKGFNSEKSHNGKKIAAGQPTEENRGQLYMWMREVISIVQPKVFVAENVKGLASLEDAKEIVEHDFSNAADGGYIVVPAKVLNAADYGVPQARERIIFYGFKKNALKPQARDALLNIAENSFYDPYPPATHSYSQTGENLCAFVTSADALAGLCEPEASDDAAQRKYSKAKYMAKGQGNTEVNLDSVAPTIRAEHHGNIEFRRLSAQNGGKHTEELANGLPQRRLTVRECARIQTFPDDYQFVITSKDKDKSVSASAAYKLIGNAVPCVFAYNIAMRLSDMWDEYFISPDTRK